MKKKILCMLLTAMMILTLTACGSSDDSDKSGSKTDADKKSEEQKEDVKEADVKEEEADDGVINFDGTNFNVTYVRHETSTDYQGSPCLLVYYNFTNNREESASSASTAYVKAFQNGVQCDTTTMLNGNESIKNYLKEVQPGTTIEICEVFGLADTSDVTLEASDLISFDNKKDTQIITLQ